MIGNFPLWMILAVWTMQRRSRARVTIYNYPRQERLIEDMRRSLPVPRGRVQVWATAKILEWLDKERSSLRTLALAWVVATVIVSKN